MMPDPMDTGLANLERLERIGNETLDLEKQIQSEIDREAYQNKLKWKAINEAIKKEILRHLCDEFDGNYPIFNREAGYQIYNGTDLSMVMDKVAGGLKAAQRKIELGEGER